VQVLKSIRKPKFALNRLRTEQSNDAARDLDCKSARHCAPHQRRRRHRRRRVARVLPQIARLLISLPPPEGRRATHLRGAGTAAALRLMRRSVRHVNIDRVQFIIAGASSLSFRLGGQRGYSRQGRDEMPGANRAKNDVVIGIASSGRLHSPSPPLNSRATARSYDRGHLQPQFPLERAAHFAIVTEVGPEILTGSSRMKAATAHKMVLNVISTGAMSRLGYVYGNLMVMSCPRTKS